MRLKSFYVFQFAFLKGYGTGMGMWIYFILASYKDGVFHLRVIC